MAKRDYYHMNAMSAETFLHKYLPIEDDSMRPNIRFDDVNLHDPKYMMRRINHSKICPGFEAVKRTKRDPLIDDFTCGDILFTSVFLHPVGHQSFASKLDAWKTVDTHILLAPDAEADLFANRSSFHDGRNYVLKNCIHEQFVCQHRTFMLTVSITGKYARFVRWDQTSCKGTKRFDFHKRPWLLSMFLWRYGQLCRAARGFDTTATLATASEERILKRALREFIKNSPRQHSDLKISAEEYPTYRVRVQGPDGKPLTVIAGKPFYTIPLSAGRDTHTRVYAGYLKSEKRIVILRDYWCRDEGNFTPDAEMYEYLQEHNVPYIPTVIAAGDVLVDGEPQTTEFCEDIDTRTPCTHQRMIQEVVFPMSSINSSKELTQVMRDTVKCLCVAYKSAGLFHQDISDGNIMVTADGRGVVNDWEIAAKIGHKCGTWHFMSTRMSINPYKVREIHDDLESCYWVLLWNAIHYIKTSAYWPFLDLAVFSSCRRARFRNGIEIDYQEQGGEVFTIGGDDKLAVLSSYDEDGLDLLKWRCAPFNSLMHKLKDVFRKLVRSVATRERARREGRLDEPLNETEEQELEDSESAFALLSDPENLLRLFDDALAQDGWLENDVVSCMLPNTTSWWKRYQKANGDDEAWSARIEGLRGLTYTKYPPINGDREKVEEEKRWTPGPVGKEAGAQKAPSISDEQPMATNRKRKSQEDDDSEDDRPSKRQR